MQSLTEQKKFISQNASRLTFDEQVNLIRQQFIKKGYKQLVIENNTELYVNLDTITDNGLIHDIFCQMAELCRRHEE
jgi:hypothetical protein